MTAVVPSDIGTTISNSWLRWFSSYFHLPSRKVVTALGWLVGAAGCNEKFTPVEHTLLHLMEGGEDVIITSHVDMNQVTVVYIQNCSQFHNLVCHWAHEGGTVTLLLVSAEDSDAYGSPPGRCCTVSLTKALKFDFYLRTSEVF